MKIWLDDIREPPDPSWEWAKNADAFSAIFYGNLPVVTEISFDHDLGDTSDPEITGYTCLCWIEKRAMHSAEFKIPKMHVHSANPVGRQKMQKVIDKLERLRPLRREGN